MEKLSRRHGPKTCPLHERCGIQVALWGLTGPVGYTALPKPVGEMLLNDLVKAMLWVRCVAMGVYPDAPVKSSQSTCPVPASQSNRWSMFQVDRQ